jgi:hypothetical protein
MATSFPSGLDSFTNPTAVDTLDSPPHDQQHADANDAIEALQAKVGVDGSAVTTSHDYMLANIGTYTAYTPVWTNFTPGNGIPNFFYTVINKFVHLQGTFELGSTSSVSGTPVMSLPVSYPAFNVGLSAMGTGFLGDTGIGTYMAQILFNSTTTIAIFRADHTVGSTIIEGGVTSTSPFTWGSGDRINVNLTYRAA